MAEQRIGKYRIIERVGRGGMGMIYKAHDPVLDRLVALKVIAPEVEVTDEMRTRFFREAQACAKLNHPNIVTVYDMGEDEGRLFISMELLEGQELRRFVTPRTLLPLEGKLSVMIQACGGLHYAHQKGIVHRDIKPGNIFLLGNGQVKILDFGIAHMASTEGLTRTGLIMGTLRYISPEQVRGRSDHRSDMFSLGSVFYELLASRPAFTGDEPMQLLEQLRTDDPTPLDEVDPSIPPALATIVQRAMRKDPAERFRDLDEMRTELEQVQRGLNDERQRVIARVRGQRERIVQLQAAVAERLGTPGQDGKIPGIDERQGLVVIQALERELEDRIAALEAEIAQVEAVSPAVRQAEALLKAGRYQEALAQFEAIVRELPDLRRAREGLEQARAKLEEQQQRQRGAELRDKARAALTERRYAQCLEIVKDASDLGLPTDLAHEMASLRERAVAEQEALRRTLQEAEEAGRHSAAARTTAESEEAAQYAPGKWNEAQALIGAAEASLRRGAYPEAKEGFARAAAAYRHALEAARQAQGADHQAAVQAREAAELGQQEARAMGAEQYARELWEAGEGKLGEAQAVFAKKTPGRGTVMFNEASALYRQAEEVARSARERERGRAEAARERAGEGRRSSAALGAEGSAPSIWQEAEDKTAAAEAAWLQQQYAKATEAFEGALRLYHQAQSEARELPRRQRERARERQQEMTERRRGAMALEAATLASADWNEAEASAAAGEENVARNAWQDALGAFTQAALLYRRAEERARESLRTRLDAEKALAAAEHARRTAIEANAARCAPEPWKEAQGVEFRAVAAFSQQQFAAARPLFDEAARLYTVAAQSAGVAADIPPHLGTRDRPDRARDELDAEEARRRTALRDEGVAGSRAEEPPRVQGKAMTLLASATERLRQGDVHAAAALLKQALELDPDLPEAHALKQQIEVKIRGQHEARRAPSGVPGSSIPRQRFGRYQVIDGPTGRVYRAWDPDNERMVAVKVIDEGNALDKERLRRAALAWKRLEKHPNLVQIYEFGVDDGQSYIAMEFLEGRDLRTLIAPRPRLSVRDKLSWISQVSEGLCHLHRKGIIHQDIRPSSIFVLQDGTVKILESGMARPAPLPQEPDATRTLFLPDDYRAPEQADGRSELRSDVFSAGKVLFELLTYRRLVPPGDPEAIEEQARAADPSLPPAVVAVIQCALRPEPRERIDIEQMRTDLREILRRVPDTTSNRGRVLFALHGIRTHAAWQKALMEVAHTHQWNCRTFLWSYGYFSLLQFLLPWQRASKIERFRDTYENEVKNRDVNLAHGQLPSIVAHSFGTYILGWALLAYRHIRFDKVILCGSILPCDFPWDIVVARGQVKGVRNEYGRNDVWPRIVRWFVRGTGPSGRFGFDSTCHREHLEQEEFFLSHSAYFDKGHVEDTWFPFLNRTTPDRPQVPVPRTRATTNVPIALYLLYVVLLIAAAWSIAKLYALLPDLLKLV